MQGGHRADRPHRAHGSDRSHGGDGRHGPDRSCRPGRRRHGPTGPTGATGATGPTGPTGATGPVGPCVSVATSWDEQEVKYKAVLTPDGTAYAGVYDFNAPNPDEPAYTWYDLTDGAVGYPENPCGISIAETMNEVIVEVVTTEGEVYETSCEVDRGEPDLLDCSDPVVWTPASPQPGEEVAARSDAGAGRRPHGRRQGPGEVRSAHLTPPEPRRGVPCPERSGHGTPAWWRATGRTGRVTPAAAQEP